MKDVNKEDSLVLTLTGVHVEDGYAWARDQIIGKKFDAFLTTTSVGHPGWYRVVGVFVDKVGIPEIDNATKEQPIVITTAHYTL
jgi:hypothetical protein